MYFGYVVIILVFDKYIRGMSIKYVDFLYISKLVYDN